MSVRRNGAIAVVVAILSLAASTAAAQGVMPLSEVRAGMRGHGLTVFQGTEPERFDVEVIGVLHQFLPRQDLILIRMDHPLLRRSGTVGGMSGSPIYVEGRLIGALAYGWQFALDPIAGVTPIETMLEELNRPLRPEPPLLGPPLPARAARGGEPAASALDALGPRPSFWQHFSGSEGPVPAATPLLLGGFSARVRQVVTELLDDFGMIPVEAGGSGTALGRAGPTPFAPGAAIGVQLLRGDLSATGIGTVTAVRGNHVLAFGHPMFGYGQQHYPVTTARIITILSSAMRSFKLGEPVATAGALIQDRQPCIIADTAREGPMTALEVRVHDRTSNRRDRFALEVVRERFLLPVFSMGSVAAALERFASDRTDLTVQMRGELQLAGRGTITLEDQAFTTRGTNDSGTLLGMRPLEALADIVNNPFEPAQVERVAIDVSFDFRRDAAEIIGAYVADEELRPGSRVPVTVVLRPFDAPEEVRLVQVELPSSTAGQEVELVITGGAAAAPPLPEPQSLDDLLRNLRRQSFPSTSLVVTLKRRAPGVSLRGHVAQNLPPGALDALRPLALDAHERPLTTVAQVESATRYIVSGSARVRVRVGDRAR